MSFTSTITTCHKGSNAEGDKPHIKKIYKILLCIKMLIMLTHRGDTVDPWRTQVWTTWIHLYVDFFQQIHWKIFWRILKDIFSCFLDCKKTVYNTYNIEITCWPFTLLVKLPVNSGLLVVKFLGESKLYMAFWPSQPCCSRVNWIIFKWISIKISHF